MQITHCYYPKDLFSKYLYNTPCLIIGLQINKDAKDYIITTLLPFNPNKLSILLEEGILKFQNGYNNLSIFGFKILGFLNYQANDPKFNKLVINFIFNNLTKYPISTNIKSNLKLIFFEVPDPRSMQFYSLESIKLTENLENIKLKQTYKDNKIDQLLFNKLKCHYIPNNLNIQEKNFHSVIKYLNQCYYYRYNFYQIANQNFKSTKNHDLKIIKPWEQSFDIFRYWQNIRIFLIKNLNLFPNAKQINQLISNSHNNSHSKLTQPDNTENSQMEMDEKSLKGDREVSNEYFLIVLDFLKFCFFFFNLMVWKKLLKVSLTARQVDIRVKQIKFIFNHFTNFNKKGVIEFIKLYNILWLIMNDIILGYTISQYMVEKSDILYSNLTNSIIQNLIYYQVDSLMSWLMNFPAGFKLNTNLAIFFGELFLWIINYFSERVLLSNFFLNGFLNKFLFKFLLLKHNNLIMLVLGSSFIISITYDLLNFITIHLNWFFYGSAKINNCLLVILRSLFNLFYGKKNNVLKKRIDSADYDLDQLLTGTLLFTITLFIIPTVFAFYLSFALVKIFLLLILITLEILINCLNHFPIFVVLLKFKDSFRVPGGINFKLLNFITDNDFSDNGNIIYLELKSVPLSFKQIFEPFLCMLNILKIHYFSIQTAVNLLTGNPIEFSRFKLYDDLFLDDYR